MDCAISVIVPIFNAEKWLLRCINRILQQPFHSLELLLVNDGSTDQSGAICEELAVSDARIKVIHKPNGGASSAKNTGLLAASGKYVVFLDADDIIDEYYFVKLYAAAEQQACDIVISGYETIPNKHVVVPGFLLHTPMNGKQFILSATKVHSGNDLCFVWRSLFSRELLNNNGVLFHEELTIGEDTIFHLEALLAADLVYAIPDPLYFYTVNNVNSLMSSPYKPYLEKSLSLQYQLRKQLSEQAGLLSHRHYKKDMAVYYTRSILGMLLRNVRNNPIIAAKEDVARVINLAMITDSTKELGFIYKCQSFKEYLYYLALKFKCSAMLFRWEFHDIAFASILSFGILGRRKRVDNRSFH